jgi:serine/threonine-protein kinase RsbW
MSKHEKHKMESSTFTIKKAKLKHLAEIRRFVDSEVSALNVHPDIIYNILLSTSEAITNIILHGYNGEEGLIEIEVKHEDESVAVYIRDEAPQFDPTQIPTPDLTLPLEDRPVGGMGVHLIRQFMDRIIYRESPQGGNELILVKENVIQKTLEE